MLSSPGNALFPWCLSSPKCSPYLHGFSFLVSFVLLFLCLSLKWIIDVLCLVVQLCPTLWDPTDCSPPGSSVCGDSPGKNIGVCCHALVHEIFPTQGLNPGLSHCRQILYHLKQNAKPMQIFSWWKCQVSDQRCYKPWKKKRLLWPRVVREGPLEEQRWKVSTDMGYIIKEKGHSWWRNMSLNAWGKKKFNPKLLSISLWGMMYN